MEGYASVYLEWIMGNWKGFSWDRGRLCWEPSVAVGWMVRAGRGRIGCEENVGMEGGIWSKEKMGKEGSGLFGAWKAGAGDYEVARRWKRVDFKRVIGKDEGYSIVRLTETDRERRGICSSVPKKILGLVPCCCLACLWLYLALSHCMRPGVSETWLDRKSFKLHSALAPTDVTTKTVHAIVCYTHSFLFSRG